MEDFVDTVKRIFSPAGSLSRLSGFEYRHQQEVMAVAVAETLEERNHLLIEAPTGVGKTLAYLVPSLLYAQREGRKAVVSTHTKTLQEQLYHKDLPIVRSILPEQASAVVMKGRKNYVCSTRLQSAVASAGSLFDDDAAAELHRIHRWSQTTPDGDMENLGVPPRADVWEAVCSEQGICSPAACGSRCFFQQARERVRGASLVIMNHALFFTLMAIQDSEERFVFDNDFVIFDEAHTLEAVAGMGTGKRLSRHQLLSSIHRLYNPATKKGLLAAQARGAKTMARNAERATKEFFSLVRQAAGSLDERTDRRSGAFSTEVRIRAPHFVLNTLERPLAELLGQLKTLEEQADEAPRRQEIASARRSLWEAQFLVDEFLEQVEPGNTYWVECSGTRGEQVALCASPTEVGASVGPRLFRDSSSVIMTSATLSVGNTLEYFSARVGAPPVRTVILDSPFDHARHMKLCLARDMPEPESGGYQAALPHWIMNCVERSGGRALVLFTSNLLMHAMEEALRDEFAEKGLKLLVQGSGKQRHGLLMEFKEDIRSVLFGLDSFWTGIDVPGEALEHVIITRLPFAVPKHPLVEARMEAIARKGGNAFLEYTLPEAVLKFRQGAGRLIRSAGDTGVVTVLDSRILRKQYGKVFLSSLPRCPIELLSAAGESEEYPVFDLDV